MIKGNTFRPEYVPPPGGTLKEKLEEMNICTQVFAMMMGRDESFIDGLFKGKNSITEEIAIELELFTDIPARCWLNGEKAYRKYLDNIYESDYDKKK